MIEVEHDSQAGMPSERETRTESQFKFYSFGIVADVKEQNTLTIEVTPTEHLPMLEGDLSHAVNNLEVKGQTADGAAYEEAGNVTATIPADWLNLGNPNRMTPPDVRRGMRVILFQYGDADKYYWETIGSEAGLMKLETVVYAYSASPDENVIELTPDNAYTIEVSTRSKYIKINTSKANKEPYAYTIMLNTAEGQFYVKDDVGNHALLNSKERHIQIRNAVNSIIEVKDKVANIITDNEINMKTQKVNINSSTLNIEATAGTTIKTPTTNHLGNLGIAGSLTGTIGEGGASGATFQGTLRVTEDVFAGNVSVRRHQHRDSGGNGIGGTPVG